MSVSEPISEYSTVCNRAHLVDKNRVTNCNASLIMHMYQINKRSESNTGLLLRRYWLLLSFFFSIVLRLKQPASLVSRGYRVHFSWLNADCLTLVLISRKNICRFFLPLSILATMPKSPFVSCDQSCEWSNTMKGNSFCWMDRQECNSFWSWVLDFIDVGRTYPFEGFKR